MKALAGSVLLWAVAGTAAGEARLGAYLGGGCDGAKRLPAFTQWLGRAPDLASDFFDRSGWGQLASSSAWSARCWKRTGLPASFAVPMLPNGPGYSLADGAAGLYDEAFRGIARTLVKEGHPDAILRLGWEFNGGWYPWAAASDPAAWVAYFRRIVTVMRGEPGARFRFDWCPTLGRQSIRPDTVYPGDDVVDFIGLDVYNQSWAKPAPTPEQRWNELLDQPYGLRWHRDFAAAHTKPVSFPEWGTGTRPDGHGGGDDPYFIGKMADWIASGNTAYQVYWDYTAGDYNGRLSDGRQPGAAAAFRERFGPTAGAARSFPAPKPSNPLNVSTAP
jgi:hypothetical protein